MRRYNEYGLWLKEQLGVKVQKISLNAGFTCPNRDGRVGVGGCTYCNNQTFNPDYCVTTKSITRQLEEGKHFFSRKYPDMKYLAYFQAYTNTYDSLQNLKAKYEEALSVPDVIGLVIGTRPDCMPNDLLSSSNTASSPSMTRRCRVSTVVTPMPKLSMPSLALLLVAFVQVPISFLDSQERVGKLSLQKPAFFPLFPSPRSSSISSNSSRAPEWRKSLRSNLPTSISSLPTNILTLSLIS